MSTVSTSHPQLQIKTRAAKLNIRQKRPRFVIRHKRPKMEIRKKAPVFKIVRSASSARAKGEPVPVVQISRRFTGAGTSASNRSNFTERIVSYATDYATALDDIRGQELESSALDKIAAENTKKSAPPDTLAIEWDRGYFEIDWTKDIMEIEWDIDSSPEIYVEPYDIEVKIKNNISTRARAKAMHMFPGTKVDRKI
jgi:hypothetical protein